MDTRTEEIFQKKAQLLVEIQSVFGEYSRRLDAHILVTRTSHQNNGEHAWSGFVSEVKKTVKQQHNQN